MAQDKYYSIRVPLKCWCILVYVSSFLLPAKNESGEILWCYGLHVFFTGFSMLVALPTLAWWANLVFWFAVLSNPTRGSALSLLAGLIALSLLMTPLGWILIAFPYFLWMGSMFLYSFACHLDVQRPETKHIVTPTDQSSETSSAASETNLGLGVFGIPFLFLIAVGVGMLFVVGILVMISLIG